MEINYIEYAPIINTRYCNEQSSSQKINFCKCGCGKVIGNKSTWAPGHHLKVKKSTPETLKVEEPEITPVEVSQSTPVSNPTIEPVIEELDINELIREGVSDLITGFNKRYICSSCRFFGYLPNTVNKCPICNKLIDIDSIGEFITKKKSITNNSIHKVISSFSLND